MAAPRDSSARLASNQPLNGNGIACSANQRTIFQSRSSYWRSFLPSWSSSQQQHPPPTPTPPVPAMKFSTSSFDWRVSDLRLSSNNSSNHSNSFFLAPPDVYSVPFIIDDQICIVPYLPRSSSSPPVKETNRKISLPELPSNAKFDSFTEFDPPSPPDQKLLSLYDKKCLKLGSEWELWLSPLELSRNFPPSLYNRLIHTPTTFLHSIIKDITRTFPQHKLFTQSKTRHMLFNVLIAYSNYDRSVGYSQGMAFIVGFLLLHDSDEARVFWMFTQLMDDQKYSLRSFYTEDCQSLKSSLSLCQSLLDSDSELKNLSDHLKNENIDVTVFVTQWLVTVYSYRFPESFTQAVWNLFIEHGYVVLFQLCLALFHHLQPILIRLSFEQIIPYVTNMQETPIEVVGVAQHIRFSEEILQRIENCKAKENKKRPQIKI